MATVPSRQYGDGLRIGEALRLSWDTSAAVTVLLQPGSHPVLRFRAEGHKSGRAELTPIAPEFAELLEEIPEEERIGPVFNLNSASYRTRRLVVHIGRKAGVVWEAYESQKGTKIGNRTAKNPCTPR